MADWGLLSGLSQGLKEGVNSFIENERYERDRSERKKRDALTQALELKQLRDSGYDYDEQTGKITKSERGLKDEETSKIKKQLDLYNDVFKSLPEDRRLGTKEGQELWSNISGLTKKLNSIYSGVPEEITPKGLMTTSEVQPPRKSQVSSSGLVKKEVPPGLQTKEPTIPGLITTSKGFLPGQLSKEDQAYNQALRKKASEIKIEEELGPVKQNQGLASGFALRMEDAEKAFSDLEDSGYDRRKRGQGFQAAFLDPFFDRLPYVGEGAAEVVSDLARGSGLLDPQLVQQRQAERNFVNALLRRESGSAISPSEFKSAEQQYFPRPGDPDELVEQKRQNRLAAFSALKTEAGPIFDRVKKQREEELSRRPSKKKEEKKGLLESKKEPEMDEPSYQRIQRFLGK